MLTPIDLRSDTVTRPTPAMREAMHRAAVGDDVFAEDPTTQALQERVAALFGHEAALFCPSGTQANQIAIQVHTRPGDEVICGGLSHIYHYEGGGIARNSGASVRLVGAPELRGRFTAADVRAGLNPPDSHYARTSLVCAEDTVNKGGGAVWEVTELAAIRKAADALGIGFHNDGARCWNAQVARGLPLTPDANYAAYGQLFHSLSVCFSKGLGAPVGSVLVGPSDFIREAHRCRKVMGGGMRQIGGLAAACLHTLDHHGPRLADDHLHAALLGAAAAANPEVAEVDPVETNIVIFRCARGPVASAVVAALAERGVLCFSFGPDRVRLVTHGDLDRAAIDRAAEAVAGFRLAD
jgi:threonine aldolase